ncbi:MAG: ABC transporter permease [Pseudomonadota bacterium]
MADRVRSSLLELTRARLLETLREPAALFWTFAFPVLLAVALGFAFSSRPPEPVRVAVLGDPLLAAQLDAAEGVARLELVGEEAENALRVGRIDLIVRAGGGPPAYAFDPTRPEGRLARRVVDDALQRAAGRWDPLAAQEAPLTAPGARYIDFLIPGLIGMNVMSSSMWGTAWVIVLARRHKLLKRLAATPMRRHEFLLSFALARAVFLALEVVALVAAGWLLFGVAVQGSLLTLALTALLGTTCFMGLALAVAARPEDTEVASGWMNVVMMPMWLLSGVFFSYERFPAALHPLLRLLPLTALNDALRSVMNEGAPLTHQLGRFAVLIGWSLVTFLLARRLFKWR